ncbi:hypothetical protein OAG62_00530 [bacterium]|nr:hypothetical protein [bacterium]
MTSLIANTLNADIDVITQKSQALLQKTDSLNLIATRMSENVARNRGGIDRTEKSTREKGGDWNLLATATLRSWRKSEKDLVRESWNPAVATARNQLKNWSPPSGLPSQPELDIALAASQAELIPPLTRELEEKMAQITSLIQPITDSSRRILETCERLRSG